MIFSFIGTNNSFFNQVYMIFELLHGILIGCSVTSIINVSDGFSNKFLRLRRVLTFAKIIAIL